MPYTYIPHSVRYFVRCLMLMLYVWPCAEGIHAPVDCYECSTHQPDSAFCADPFNRSHPHVKTAVCKGPCSKLVQRPPNGL